MSQTELFMGHMFADRRDIISKTQIRVEPWKNDPNYDEKQAYPLCV